MQTTLLGSTGARSFTDDSGSDSPVSCSGAKGWPAATATTRSAGSSPGPSTTPKATSPEWEKRAMRTARQATGASGAVDAVAEETCRVRVLERLPRGRDDVLVHA